VAPELFYDDENDQYLIIYASCVVDAHFELGVEDELNNHRLYCVKTRTFRLSLSRSSFTTRASV